MERLLRLNEPDQKPYVEVFLLSRNSPDLSLRAFNSIAHYGLGIRAGSFTSGRSLGPFISAWELDLFLSNEITDVQAAIEAGAAAAKLGTAPEARQEDPSDEVRFAFDGDAVVFSAESDELFKNQGLQAFLAHENTNVRRTIRQIPAETFLRKIFLNEKGVSRVRIAIVTARNAPAHARVVHTLRDWGTPADEAHFVGVRPKGPILQALGAHIFFDDQIKHVLSASGVVPSGHVPGAPTIRTSPSFRRAFRGGSSAGPGRLPLRIDPGRPLARVDSPVPPSKICRSMLWGCVMEQQFYQGLAQRVRSIAEKADPFTRRRLLDLAKRYDAKGGKSIPAAAARPLPTPRTTPPTSIFSGPGEA